MKNYKSKFSSYFYVLILFLIIFQTTGFFKNGYLILRDNYQVRFSKNYEFCSGSALGFLNYINNNYDVSENIKIKNFEIAPDSNWFFYKGKSKSELSNELVLLNYQDNTELKFKNLGDNIFVSISNPENILILKRIIFKKNFDVKKIEKLEIINKISDFEKVLLSYKLKNNNYGNNELKLNINVKDINIYYGNLIFKFTLKDLSQMDDIKEFKIIYDNEYNLENYKIIDKKENCYFLKKI